MNRRKLRTPAALALCLAVAGVGLVGCSDDSDDEETSSSGQESSGDASEESAGANAEANAAEGGQDFTGTKKITAGDHSVNVSCSGTLAEGRPVVVLMHGGGHDLTTMADFQETLAANNRVCSYDRLGAGASDQPTDLQDYDDVGETLTAVLDEIAGDAPVVLAGHSMGGLLAARYAPDHQDRVQGLVLMDATSPSAVADLKDRIPEDAGGDPGELREMTLAVYAGGNPEQLVFTDAEVESAGDIPVKVIQHGVQYLGEVPEYGPGLEEDWTAGQEQWLGVSTDSELITAEESDHDIYVNAPELAAEAVEEVADEAVA